MNQLYETDSAQRRGLANRRERYLTFTLLALFLPTLLLLHYAFSHYIANFSPSAPMGLYNFTHQPVKEHSQVALRMPLKTVVAMGGDLVEFAPDGIRVSGELIPNSAPVKGYPHFPFGKYITPAGMYVCLGDHPYSWDSRYVGFIPESLVYSTVKPVWVNR